MLKKLAIIGVGLIGGSFAQAVKKQGLAQHIAAFGRHRDNLETALNMGLVDSISEDIECVAKEADMIFIATPVGSFADILTRLKPLIKEHTIITDAGSTKQNLLDTAKAVFGQIPPNLVPGHPIAGTENSGAAAAVADLFMNHKVILTPVAQTRPKALETVRAIWQKIGAQVVLMDAAHHDMVLGATSHLPHIIAYTLVDSLATLNQHKEIFAFAAGGFKDFTRIASSNPQMWVDICMHNREAILQHLQNFQKDLRAVEQALQHQDEAFLRALFSRAKQARDNEVIGA